jgi:hypothetical protein
MLRLSRSRWVSLASNLLLLAVVLLSWGYVLYAGKAGRHLAFFIFLYTVFCRMFFQSKMLYRESLSFDYETNI